MLVWFEHSRENIKFIGSGDFFKYKFMGTEIKPDYNALKILKKLIINGEVIGCIDEEGNVITEDAFNETINLGKLYVGIEKESLINYLNKDD